MRHNDTLGAVYGPGWASGSCSWAKLLFQPFLIPLGYLFGPIKIKLK
jgi:hypothetical protein